AKQQTRQTEQTGSETATRPTGSTKTATTEPAAATTRSGPAAAERSKAIKGSEVTGSVWGPERSATEEKRPKPGEERGAKKAPATACRDPVSLSRHRQATRPTAFTIARKRAKRRIAEPRGRTK